MTRTPDLETGDFPARNAERCCDVAFVRLPQVPLDSVMQLLNCPRVRGHLPFATGSFDRAATAEWVRAKDRLWGEFGYGPWGFMREGAFVGWGGFQPEDDEPDVALVLLPEMWGQGKLIWTEMLRRAREVFRFSSVTALLPHSRSAEKVMGRLGFRPDGTTRIAGHTFYRFRCDLHRTGAADQGATIGH